MMTYSLSTIAFAVGITTVLMIANWFIWKIDRPRGQRSPVTGGVTAARDVGPQAAVCRLAPQANGQPPFAPDSADDCFKHVA